ncbi:tripartite motif-containing protein 16-like protein isoform X1 [Erpetoichthys calabaricus]|uniref:tripartite motif-containing protein 16-like protein isoform X1 n=1 Tax=Erpetoichthys calabaricus TaxID=27687 RepID=UPI00223484C1|nr:tripartite motif-containing protein 16-like protein isoform X1 [Erpetoichthys calabaricus]
MVRCVLWCKKYEEKNESAAKNSTDPRSRQELLQYYLELTFNPNTAQKNLWLSEGNRKIIRREETCPYPQRPERFEYIPQVLCKESLYGGCFYWEVELKGGADIGVTYENIGRKGSDGCCGLGESETSWSFGWDGSSYRVWHNSKSEEINAPPSPHIGIYLDYNNGSLHFYGVSPGSESEIVLLYQFKAVFTEPLYPCFWVGANTSIFLCKP